MKKVAILGSGGWGVALSLILHKNGHEVKIWSYTEEEKDIINNERKCKFLPNVDIPEEIKCYNDFDKLIPEADIILVVTPSSAIRNTLNKIKEYVNDNQIFLLASKGIEAKTQMIYTDVIKEIYPNNKIAVISGPSHAEEVSRFIPTCVVISSNEKEVSNELQQVFMNEIFRVYVNNDVVGVELGAALKNIIALASGICAGLEYGDNSQAALITRGLLEISRIGMALGGKFQTFYGLTGFGDLFVTCSSMNSRNRRCGIMIGQGLLVEEAKSKLGGMVVEGIEAVNAAYELINKYNIYAPIIMEMYEIIHNNKPANDAVKDLMTRAKKHEFDDYKTEQS